MTTFWTSYPSIPGRAADVARQVEAAGWDGLATVDSQNLSGDPYVFLSLASQATSSLGLMTSVTNPVTRHAAVTATSALTVQKLSNGRMALGIGRGDSALAYLGRAPARLAWFESYMANVQLYMAGSEVAFEQTGISDDICPPVASLDLADAPSASAIHWARGVEKPPVEVAATGARVIGIAARHADRILLAVGADPQRIRWGIETARQAAVAAGRDPDALQFGAYVNLACTSDREAGREIARAGTSLFARFSVMHGKVNGPADDSQQQVFNNVHDRYDMNKHAQSGGNQTTALTDEFMDRYAIVGDARHCIDRLGELIDLGINKFCVVGPALESSGAAAGQAAADFNREVMPALR